MSLSPYLLTILSGIVMGTVARGIMLRSDYRQYPSYPHGYAIHLTIGFIASALGALAVPAILEKQYTAVTFLALAAQQFRDIRKMERDSLRDLEAGELVPRGPTYIDGIAKVFEARNYLAMITALVTAIVVEAFPRHLSLVGVGVGIVVGFATMGILSRAVVGRKIGDVCDVRPAKLHFRGPNLYVDDIYIMNVGLPESRKAVEEKGLAVLVVPKSPGARATLANVGQRQAIAHDAASILGLHKDVGELEFTPLVRLNHDDGSAGVYLVPQEENLEAFIQAVKNVPLLESARRQPASSQAGRIIWPRRNGDGQGGAGGGERADGR